MQKVIDHVQWKKSKGTWSNHRKECNQPRKGAPPRGIKKETSKAALEEEDKREDIPPPIKTHELHIWDQPISKL